MSRDSCHITTSLLLANTMGVRTHGTMTASLLPRTTRNQKKGPRDHDDVFRATDNLGSIKSPLKTWEGLITKSAFHQGSADFWTNEFIVLYVMTSGINIIDKICLNRSSEHKSHFFVFFKPTQEIQTVNKNDVSFSAHFVVSKLFDRRRHIWVTSAWPLSVSLMAPG